MEYHCGKVDGCTLFSAVLVLSRGQTDRQTDTQGQTDRQTDRQTHRRTNRQINSFASPTGHKYGPN